MGLQARLDLQLGGLTTREPVSVTGGGRVLAALDHGRLEDLIDRGDQARPLGGRGQLTQAQQLVAALGGSRRDLVDPSQRAVVPLDLADHCRLQGGVLVELAPVLCSPEKLAPPRLGARPGLDEDPAIRAVRAATREQGRGRLDVAGDVWGSGWLGLDLANQLQAALGAVSAVADAGASLAAEPGLLPASALPSGPLVTGPGDGHGAVVSVGELAGPGVARAVAVGIHLEQQVGADLDQVPAGKRDLAGVAVDQLAGLVRGARYARTHGLTVG